MTIIPVLFLMILTATARADGDVAVSLSFWVGFGLQIMYIAYFGMVGYLFWSGHKQDRGGEEGKTHLFRILTKTGTGTYHTYFISYHKLT